MAKQRPKNLKRTLSKFFMYMGHYKVSLCMIGLLVICSTGANLYGTYMLQPLIDEYILPQNTQGFTIIMIFMAGMYLSGVICSAIYKQWMTHIAQNITKEIRRDLFHKMQKLPLSYFDTTPHGDIMSRFTNDLDTLQDALNNCFDNVIQSFMMIVGTMIAIYILNWKLSIIVTIFMIGMYFFIKFYSKRSKYYFSLQQKAMGDMNGFIEEMIEGNKVVKVFHHEDEIYKKFLKKNEAVKTAGMHAFTYSGRTIPTVVSMSYFNYAIVAMIGGFFAISNEIALGALASYLVYVRQTALPVNQFTQQLNFLLVAIAGAERIFMMMDEIDEVDTGTVRIAKMNQDTDHKQLVWKQHNEVKEIKGYVRFEHVVFGYKQNQTVLKGIDLYAKPGQKIAFVGSTGAGKTTITNLVNRFYDIQQGRILFDGIDVKDIKKSDLRRCMSIVLQDTHVFTGTIRENIRYGNLHATDEEVIAAAKLANAHSFIKRLPKGYDTILTGDGENLSQGQRQLLAIARAAIADPYVLILDEATSSIDSRTEKLIEEGMDKLMEGRTVFVIAHRLSTIRNADAIMVLEQGEIIERGTHEELLEKQGRYYQLYTGQCELT